jgi:hypothetical protein
MVSWNEYTTPLLLPQAHLTTFLLLFVTDELKRRTCHFIVPIVILTDTLAFVNRDTIDDTEHAWYIHATEDIQNER